MINFPTFLFLATLLVLVPGPDFVIITKNTITGGKSAGLKTLFGTLSALFCHTILAVIGLSALLVKSAMLFSLLKLLGAVYLLYLGIKALLAKEDPVMVKETKGNNPLAQGLLTNLLNPKVVVFFLTFLPQFVATDNQSFLPFALLGLSYLIVTGLIFGLYVLFLEKIRHLMEKPRTQLIINKVSGLFLLFFGLKLLLDRS